MWKSWVLFLWLNSYSILLAQFSYLTQDEHWKKGYAIGAHLSTNGIGGDLWIYKWLDPYYRIIRLSAANLRDPSEVRVESLYKSQGGKNFVFDKINRAYALRFLYGYSYALIPASRYQGVDFGVGVLLGPELALLKPYVIDVAVPIAPGQVVPVATVYDHTKYSYQDIIGEGSFFSNAGGGIHGVPGIHIEIMTMINLDPYFFLFQSLHGGIQADIFLRPLPIMDVGRDRQVFLSAYLGIYFGNSW
jgi:hypothetical protein